MKTIAEDRFEAAEGAQRGVAPFLLLALLSLLVTTSATLDIVTRFLQVTSTQVALMCAVVTSSNLLATLVYHSRGPRSRLYAICDVIETGAILTSLLALAIASNGQALFWCLYLGMLPIIALGNFGGALVVFAALPGLVGILLHLPNGEYGQALVCLVVVVLALVVGSIGREHHKLTLDAALEREALRKHIADLVLERERGRIARDLHDGMAGELSALGSRLDLLSRDAARSAENSVVLLQEFPKLRDRTRRSIEDLRSIVWAYRQPASSIRQALDYVRERCTEICPAEVALEFQLDPPDGELDGGRALQLLRISQEAVWNALRHGAPTRILISAFSAGDDLVLRVADNGSGELPFVEDERHGLRNMKRRAEICGGEMNFSETYGGGTTLTFTLPRFPPASGTDEHEMA